MATLSHMETRQGEIIMKMVERDGVSYAIVKLPKWYNPWIMVILIRRLVLRYLVRSWMIPDSLVEYVANRMIVDAVLLFMLGAPEWITGMERGDAKDSPYKRKQ